MNTQTIEPAGHHHPSTDKACCHAAAKDDGYEASIRDVKAPHSAAHAPHQHHAGGNGLKAAASVTLHCLTGCAIGEWLGLAIGTSLHLPATGTITLAVILSFVSGFALTLVPLMKGGMRFRQAMKIVWVGEVVSIAMMELVMNLVDYHMGGMQQGMRLLTSQYWIAFGTAAVAGYIAAVPVNYWLLQRNLKNCH